MILPFSDRVLIELMNEEYKTKSGIIIPETIKSKTQIGKVISVGNGKNDLKGNKIEMEVKVDDIVIYEKYAGTEIEYNDTKYLFFKQGDIIAKIIEK